MNACIHILATYMYMFSTVSSADAPPDDKRYAFVCIHVQTHVPPYTVYGMHVCVCRPKYRMTCIPYTV